jgi:hypothetical protein
MSTPDHRSNLQPFKEVLDLTDKDKFWQTMHDGFARLRSDPVAWVEYLDEAALRESTACDGLEDAYWPIPTKSDEPSS